MRSYLTMGALCAYSAMAVLAANKDQGHAPDPVAKSDPAPAPLSADQVTPAAPHPEPGTGGPGDAPGADPNPPTNKEDAPKVKGRIAVIWAQPGHEQFAIGQILRFPKDHAEMLRSAGRARYASDAEIKAAGKDIPDVEV